MGKSYSKWLARLLRRKKPTSAGDPPRRSFTDDGATNIPADPNKHAIAVAAATAAVAEAALAAAKAAAEVVRLTSRRGPVAAAGRGDVSKRRWSVEDYLAAVRIQSAFRGYLARRALRALKGLVKLQALVRGHFVRKRSTDMLKRMQAMVRVQARARANRLQHVETIYHGPERNRKLDHQRQVCSMKLNEASLLKRSGSVSSTRDANIHTSRANPSSADCLRTGSHNSLSRTAHMDDEKADKILEIDSWQPHLAPIISRNYPSCNVSAKDYYAYESHLHSFAASDTYPKYSTNHSLQSRSPCNSESVLTLRSLNLPPMEQDFSPQACSVPSRPGSSHSKTRATSPYTPTRNECARSLYGEGEQMGMYYPSYMGYTESSRAKVRSQSAPRQRVEWFESHGSSKRLYTYGSDYRVSRRNPSGDGFELGK